MIPRAFYTHKKKKKKEEKDIERRLGYFTICIDILQIKKNSASAYL